MPNYCANMLEISMSDENDEGQKATLESFLVTYEDGLEFGMIRPIPEELKGVHTGSIHINGASHKNWRDIDGKKVPLTEDEIADYTARFGATNWYDWSVANWGTKWDIDKDESCFFRPREAKAKIRTGFQTAWSPAREFVAFWAKQHPTLVFEHYYLGEGDDYAGLDRYENGELVDEKYEDDGLEEAPSWSWWHEEMIGSDEDEDDDE